MFAKFGIMIAAALMSGVTGVIFNAPPGRVRSMPSLGGATQWLNSSPLTATDLRGKVVLVEFWTYTCVNWRRTLPYVRAWSEKYAAHGLVVIGVHTPEFSFEKDATNVRWAIKAMDIGFPVAMDNNYEIWRAFQNQYWPAIYIVDAKGHIRNHQFGEGNYDQSEMVIQQLLTEAGAKGFGHELTPVTPVGAEVAADWGSLASPETYLNYERTQGFSSPGGAKAGRQNVYALPASLQLNQWAFSGNWTMGREADIPDDGNGRIVYRFHARDVNLIMGPAGPTAPGTAWKFRVLLDGKPPGPAHGGDVDADGNGTITEQRMYQLIRQPMPISDREIEIEFEDKGVAVYDFTFG